MGSLIKGLTFWIQGWRFLLSEKSLLIWIFIPMVVALAAAVSIVTILFEHLPAWVQWLLQQILSFTPSWFHYLYYPLWVGNAILILVAGVFIGYLLQGLLAIPFYAFLAEKTLVKLGVLKDRPFTFSGWVKSSIHMLAIGLIKTFVFLALGVVLFICSFIPGLNILTMFFALLILTIDLLDYSFESLRFGLKRRIGFVVSQPLLILGMVTGLGLTIILPGLTLLIAPGAVVGAGIVLRSTLSEGTGHGS